MARRSHKKSRRGCVECKRRHRKCDETRPICVNCSTTHLHCSYIDQQSPPAPAPSTIPAAQSTTIESSPVLSPPPAIAVLPLPNDAGGTEQPARAPAGPHAVDMHHMELLSHFLLETCHSFGFSQPSNLQLPRQLLMATALATPYLMYEILAIAALHLSRLRTAGGQAKFYQDEAAVLQTHAISLFNGAHKADDDDLVGTENCVPMFFFSAFLGVHMLADVAAPGNNNNTTTTNGNFLDRFVVYMDIHRGVRAITSHSWQFLCQTDLQPLLQMHAGAAAPGAQAHQPETPRECDGLRKLLESADMSPSPLKACEDAVGHLQWVFDSERQRTASRTASIGLVNAWPILVSAGFTDLLLKRVPEALVILAHYAVLLHTHRGVWVVADSGRLLVEFITEYLGMYWKHWLAWPNSVLETSTGSSAPVA